MFTKFLAVSIFSVLSGTFANAQAKIDVMTSPCPEAVCGSGVSVYIDGLLDGSESERIDSLVLDGTITPYSIVYLNSPGGSLLGGMELAKTIRKYGFNTSVGKIDPSGGVADNGAICLSACSLAFLGGVFRYFHDENYFGVHRFYRTEPSEHEGELAQIASAAIIEFLKEMKIAPDFFVEMTKAGPESMRMLDLDQMLRLNIANNGTGPTSWSITASNPETGASFLYLKGERDTSFGVNKLLFLCSADKSSIILHAIFDPQGRSGEVLAMKAISLELDGTRYPFHESLIPNVEIVNGWVNASFQVPDTYWSEIKSAREVGILFQFSYDAPLFLGFSGMDLSDSKKLMLGFESSCVERIPPSPKSTYKRYPDTDFFGADLTKKGIKGISLARCEAVCDATQNCTAYSYVASVRWCFPKLGVDQPVAKPGTISGLK